MRLFKTFVMGTCLFCILSGAYAKDMTGRPGIGFIDEFDNSSGTHPVPAISFKYGLSKGVAWSAAIGFNTSTPSSVTLGSKLFKNIFYEPSLNFYTMVGGAYVKGVQSGFEVLGGLGAEFFIPGIDSVGWSFETGVAGTNVSGTFIARTIGYTFLNAGMHFYF